MTHEKIELRNNELGHGLSAYIAYPDRPGEYPAVIFVHGYRSSKEGSKAQALLEKLPEKDFVVLVLDLSGCGESDGEFEDSTITKYVSDVKAGVNYLATLSHVDSSRIGLIGSSLGGMVAIEATEIDPRIKALVLLSPVSDFKQLRDFRDKEKVEMWRIEGRMDTFNHKGRKFEIKYGFYRDGITHDTYAEAEKINCPVVVIHGNKDESVDISQSQELMKHLRNGKLEIIEGADHRYTNIAHFSEIIHKTINFLEEHLI